MNDKIGAVATAASGAGFGVGKYFEMVGITSWAEAAFAVSVLAGLFAVADYIWKFTIRWKARKGH